MLRKIVSTSLVISFIAIATSGLMMFFIGRPSFTIQMHAVHKFFGLFIVIAGIIHIYFNYRAIISYLKKRSIAIYLGVLIVVLVVLYGVAVNKEIPPELAKSLDSIYAEIEGLE